MERSIRATEANTCQPSKWYLSADELSYMYVLYGLDIDEISWPSFALVGNCNYLSVFLDSTEAHST